MEAPEPSDRTERMRVCVYELYNSEGSSFSWITYISKVSSATDASLNTVVNFIYTAPMGAVYHLGKHNVTFLDGHAANRSDKDYLDRWYDWFPMEPVMPLTRR